MKSEIVSINESYTFFPVHKIFTENINGLLRTAAAAVNLAFALPNKVNLVVWQSLISNGMQQPSFAIVGNATA